MYLDIACIILSVITIILLIVLIEPEFDLFNYLDKYMKEDILVDEEEIKKKTKAPVVICCGKKGIDFLDNKKIPYIEAHSFDDKPVYSDACELFEQIKKHREPKVLHNC